MNENVKKVFDYLDEAKRIYFNICKRKSPNGGLNQKNIYN